MIYQERIQHCTGTAYEVGYAAGRRLGQRLEQLISDYQHSRPDASGVLPWEQLKEGALPWLWQLPLRFQEEYEGLAAGSGVPLQRIAEWGFLDTYLDAGCSGCVCYHDGQAWVGRNNDMFAPNMWGYVLIREITGRLPTISLSLEGDIFSPSGLNQAQLWIHHQYLPVRDTPRPTRTYVSSYVFVTDALETCTTIQEVENLLQNTDRDDGMLLVVVDGKTEEAAIFECNCQQTKKREPVDQRLVCTNHACLMPNPFPHTESLQRYRRLEQLVLELTQTEPILPEDLIGILGDDGIEQRDSDFGTVYSAVMCPGTQALWYTFGGYPAASQGNWQPIPWPW